ncbi:MAG: VCBS repeat-containing protein, partial [Phaeodactylibacter sp.]|nr:VCBS repeat-containing protein [Phaeodactylibacter sp.]
MLRLLLLVGLLACTIPLAAQFLDPIYLQNEYMGNGRDKFLYTDLDGDGKKDLFLANLWATWYKQGDEPEQFIQQQPFALSTREPREIWQQDVDGDLDEDILVLASFPFGYGTTIYWLENLDGNGHFGPHQQLLPSWLEYEFDGFLFADINNDGYGDLINQPDFNGNYENETFINRFDSDSGTPGFVGFEELFPDFTALQQFRDNAVVDLDQDGLLDFMTIGKYEFLGQNYIGLLGSFNSGDPAAPFTDISILLYDVPADLQRWGDLNQDNYPDLLLLREDGVGSIYWNDQAGGLEYGGTVPNFGSLDNMQLLDMDGDNDLDLLKTSTTGADVVGSYARYDSQQDTFEAVQPLPPIDYPVLGTKRIQAVEDFDNDGDLDLLVEIYDNSTGYVL